MRIRPNSVRAARTPLVAVLTVAAALVALDAQRATVERHVTAVVLGPGDTPVDGLGLRDVIVREDGIAREIIRVTRAAPPSHVAIIVDTSDVIEPALVEIRRGVADFSRRLADLPDPPSQALITAGERPMRVVNFTPRGVAAEAERLVYRRGSGSYLLDAIVETVQAFRQREAPRPVIVAFSVASGPEFSSANRIRIEDLLRDTRVALWTIEIRSDGAPSSPENLERDAVVTDVARRSGGFSRSVLSKEGLSDAFVQTAALLTSAYDITYGRPDSLIPPSRIEVTARDTSHRVVATEWLQP